MSITVYRRRGNIAGCFQQRCPETEFQIAVAAIAEPAAIDIAIAEAINTFSSVKTFQNQ